MKKGAQYMKLRKLSFTYFALIVLSMLILSTSGARACLGPMMETQTFILTKPPAEAKHSNIVAKVNIVKIITDGVAAIEVLENIKGTKEGETFNVLYDIHSCARDYNVKADQIYYIAGDFNEKGVFVGSWKGLAYDPHWPLATMPIMPEKN